MDLKVIRRYLEDQVELGAHILGFRSTHQTYKTVEYELHRTNSEGDTSISFFRDPVKLQVALKIQRNLMLHTKCGSGVKLKLMYLLDYWSDGAHILQFCRPGEYFETAEYEKKRTSQLRDIVR